MRPTIDRVAGPGDQTSISDARDNVHWHHAETAGVLLDVLQSDGDEDTHFVDVERAIRQGDTLRAPRIDVPTALARYG